MVFFSQPDFQLNSHLTTLASIHKIHHTLHRLVNAYWWLFLTCVWSVFKPSHLFFLYLLIFPWQNLTEDVGQDNHPTGENGSSPRWVQHCSHSKLIIHMHCSSSLRAGVIIRLISFTYELSSPSLFAFYMLSLLLKSHATQEKEETLSWRWLISQEKPPGQVSTVFESLK